jgi:hypothetical protein
MSRKSVFVLTLAVSLMLVMTVQATTKTIGSDAYLTTYSSHGGARWTGHTVSLNGSSYYLSAHLRHHHLPLGYESADSCYNCFGTDPNQVWESVITGSYYTTRHIHQRTIGHSQKVDYTANAAHSEGYSCWVSYNSSCL